METIHFWESDLEKQVKMPGQLSKTERRRKRKAEEEARKAAEASKAVGALIPTPFKMEWGGADPWKSLHSFIFCSGKTRA